MSCGVGRRCISGPTLLWLWCRPAAIAPIRPLAWESQYAVGAALEKAKKKKSEKNLKPVYQECLVSTDEVSPALEGGDPPISSPLLAGPAPSACQVPFVQARSPFHVL